MDTVAGAGKREPLTVNNDCMPLTLIAGSPIVEVWRRSCQSTQPTSVARIRSNGLASFYHGQKHGIAYLDLQRRNMNHALFTTDREFDVMSDVLASVRLSFLFA